MLLLPIVPFVLMLLAIALLPLVAPHWWESNANKARVALILGVPVAGYLLLQGEAGWHRVQHTLVEYVEFIVLLSSLYTISGGIALRGDLQATPVVNSCFLGLGAVLASIMGTTGASMLLIRPLLQTNAERRYVAHTVVFFIFLVSNIGGCLTPLGDPPLFLGYLRGVPFTWTLSLWPAWLAMVVVLLVVYGVWDIIMHARESPQALQFDRTHLEPLRLQGSINFLFLGLVITAVALVPSPWRMLLMLAATGGSLLIGETAARHANQFTYAPIIEVAVLFLGIFLTMIPVLAFLDQHGASLGVNTPVRFFWISLTLGGTTVAGVQDIWLKAISLGAVCMGANSYIGNGPNFMVKAVAEDVGIRMPSFFGYMIYSGLILLPLFVGVTLVVF